MRKILIPMVIIVVVTFLGSCTIIPLVDRELSIYSNDIELLDLSLTYKCSASTSYTGSGGGSVEFRVPNDTEYTFWLTSESKFGTASIVEYDDSSFSDGTTLERDSDNIVNLLESKFYRMRLSQGDYYGAEIEVVMWKP